MKFLRIFIAFTLFASIVGCRSRVEFPGSNVDLMFSADTVYLDTVFTGLGSSTRILKVFNPTSENITVDRVYLGRGANSYYRLNVDGISGKDVEDIEILAHDSTYVFIEVSPDAAGATELIYKDSILFENGSVQQHVDLITTVQDAIYHFPTNVLTIERPSPLPPLQLAYSILGENEVWDNSRPHVIYGYAVVDSAHTLTITQGTQVHFHQGSGLWVYRDGALYVDPGNTSDIQNAVVFQGDRLEPSYEWVPGQWGGLLGGVFIQGGASSVAELNNLIIKNATTALRIDSAWGSSANAELHNVLITHSSRVGIYGGFANLRATNLAIGPSGVYGLYGLGGNYRLDHATLRNSWSFSSRGGTALGFVNFFEDANGTRYTRPVSALLTNTYIGGNLPNEVALGIDSTEVFSVQFRNSALKIEPNPEAEHYSLSDTSMFSQCLTNQIWNFTSSALIPEQQWKFIPDSVSTLFNNSSPSGITPAQDLLGIYRTVPGTIGAVERP